MLEIFVVKTLVFVSERKTKVFTTEHNYFRRSLLRWLDFDHRVLAQADG